MQKDSLAKLQRIAEFQRFSKDEYICYEGQPGQEMYVVLQGSVGVYLTTATGEQTEVSRIDSGGFFGEMSIFDKMPRSASCIALEETICISIDKSNLRQFLDNCPDIVERMLVSMSLRVRSMDKLLARTRVGSSRREGETAFVIPASYHSSQTLEPRQDPNLLQVSKESCPLCGEPISITHVRRRLLPAGRVSPDRRTRYEGCDPLWHEVLTCPYCLYSNHYLSFFDVNADNREQIHGLLLEQYPVVSPMRRYATTFDRLVYSYLQAIHLNERIHGADHTLPGMLWLRLYWLAGDGENAPFAAHCAKNAVRHLMEAIDQAQISDPVSRCSIALSTAHLLAYLGAPDVAKKYCTIASNSPDEALKKQALILAKRL